jgi:anaerobic magnesium-protoporphyrin IX monomethyl ester cyclase
MKILLVAPPWLDIYDNFRAAAKLGCVSPPLGLMYLAGAIIETGSDCQILDMESRNINIDDLISIIRDYNPDLVGITTTTPIYANAKHLVKILRSHFPQLVLAMGGVHPTIVGKEVMVECPELDFIACGEGELLIKEVISNLELRKSLESVPGIIYRNGKEIIENPRRQLVENLDDIPKPVWHLLDLDLFQHSVPGKGFERYATIFTSRGCPFKCAFCSQHTMYGRRVRWHSIQRVLEELDYIVNKLDVKHVIIMDETLTLNKKRMFSICKEITNRNLKFTWEGWTHVSTVDEELLHAMKSAGLIRLSFGIESGDQNILNKINKAITLDQVQNAYMIADRVGIETRGSAMLGHPYETRETAWRTIRFLRSIKECRQIFLNVACPYPGTELYDCRSYWKRRNETAFKRLFEI